MRLKALLFAGAMLAPCAASAQCDLYGSAVTEFMTRTEDQNDTSSFGLAAVRISAVIYAPYPGPTCIADALVGFGSANAAWARPMEADGTVEVNYGYVTEQGSLIRPEQYVRIGEMYESSGFRDILTVEGSSEGVVTVTGHLEDGYYSTPVNVWLRNAMGFDFIEPTYFADRGGSFSIAVSAIPGEQLQLVLLHLDQFIGVTPGLADEAGHRNAYGIDYISVTDGLELTAASEQLVLKDGVYIYSQTVPISEPPAQWLLLVGLSVLGVIRSFNVLPVALLPVDTAVAGTSAVADQPRRC